MHSISSKRNRVSSVRLVSFNILSRLFQSRCWIFPSIISIISKPALCFVGITVHLSVYQWQFDNQSVWLTVEIKDLIRFQIRPSAASVFVWTAKYLCDETLYQLQYKLPVVVSDRLKIKCFKAYSITESFRTDTVYCWHKLHAKSYRFSHHCVETSIRYEIRKTSWCR